VAFKKGKIEERVQRLLIDKGCAMQLFRISIYLVLKGDSKMKRSLISLSAHFRFNLCESIRTDFAQ